MCHRQPWSSGVNHRVRVPTIAQSQGRTLLSLPDSRGEQPAPAHPAAPDNTGTSVFLHYLIGSHLNQPAGCPLLAQHTEKATRCSCQHLGRGTCIHTRLCVLETPTPNTPVTSIGARASGAGVFQSISSTNSQPPVPPFHRSHISLQDTQLLLLLSISHAGLSWEQTTFPLQLPEPSQTTHISISPPGAASF